MKRLIILAGLTILSSAVFSQVNYLDFKDRYSLSCSTPDSAELTKNQHLLDSLHELEISGGEDEYLYDLGMVYYRRYLKWKNAADLQTAATSIEKGWNEYNDLRALWNLGGVYIELGNCEKALDLTELYLEQVPDSVTTDYEQIYYRYKLCRKKE